MQRNAAGTVVRAFDEDGALDYVALLGADGLWRKYDVPTHYFDDVTALVARSYGFSRKALTTDGPLPAEEAEEFANPWKWWAWNPLDEVDIDVDGNFLRVRSAGQTVFEVQEYSARRATIPSPSELLTVPQRDQIQAIAHEGDALATRLERIYRIYVNDPRAQSASVATVRRILRQQGLVVHPVRQGARVSQTFASGTLWSATVDVVRFPRFVTHLSVSRLPPLTR